MLDDGRMTDGKGRVVDFSNCVIFLTSNIGSQQLLEGANEDSAAAAAVREGVMAEVRAHFRPEFINRLDETVVFQKLSQAHLRKVAQLLLHELAVTLNPSIT